MSKIEKTPIRNFSFHNILKCQKRFKISNGVKILISSIVVFAVLFLSNSVQAQSLLDIEFENEPESLFKEESFLPGDNTTGWVKVTNISGETQKIGIEIINKYSCSENCLSDKLDLVISEGENGNPLAAGSLTAFYKKGETYLSDLDTGENTKYYFSISFNSETDNNYQSSKAEFDIKIGAFGKESISGEIIPGAGGGGGGIIISGLQISNEVVSNVQEHQATITWLTNEPSTSRIIYSYGDLPHLLQINNPPNYGYVFSSPEDPTKVSDHTIVIDNLLSGTTYYFRCVSHTSPENSISQEYSFTTKGVAGTEIVEEVIPSPETGVPSEKIGVLPEKVEKPEELISEEEKRIEGPLTEERALLEFFAEKGLLAVIGTLPFNTKLIIILTLVVMLGLIILWLFRRRRSNPPLNG